MQLHQDEAAFADRDTVIVTIGPEKADAFSKYFTENGLSFVGLPDPTQKVLKLYGQKVNLFKLGRMPAQMLVDKAGNLRYIHYGHDMQDIPANEEMLGLIDSL